MSTAGYQKSGSYGHNRSQENCQFYERIGACRHGKNCSKRHNKPLRSRTVLISGLYQNPLVLRHKKDEYIHEDMDESERERLTNLTEMPEDKIDEYAKNFFQDIFIECVKMRCQIEQMIICNNLNDHLNGNVYIKFRTESMAEKVIEEFSTRWYDNKPIFIELSPVYDFKHSCCNQYFSKNTCDRGEMCNFIHIKKIDSRFIEDLMMGQYKYLHDDRRRT